MEITQRFDEDGINLNRESVFYDGMWWHRYPNAKETVTRNYFHKGINNKITFLHRYIWEKHNGKQPKGYEVHHVDDNPANNKIDNLILLTKAEHCKVTWTGKKHSDESKKKMSISMMGKTNRLGKTHSQETKLKMSITAKKRWADKKALSL